jgi:nucleoside-diphosphate-sugar epimerase
MKIKLLLTGASGFLGNVLHRELSDFYDLTTLGRSNDSVTHIYCDLKAHQKIVFKHPFDIVIHTAGKAHIVPKTEQEKADFYSVNVDGTISLLASLASMKVMPKCFVFISTVAVYGLVTGSQVNEDYPLKATDAYGHSKIMAEKVIQEWCLKHNVICTILRLPLIVGQNPKGNLKSMINGIKRGYYINIGKGNARKSMVLATDVAKFVPNVANIGGIYNLTDGNHPNFKELGEYIAINLGKNKPLNLPKYLISPLAKIGDLFGSFSPINSDKFFKITSELTFDDNKARNNAGWNPTPIVEGLNFL